MKNLIAATYAPMKENGNLNPQRVEEYAQFVYRNNINGVFINGSTGDFVSLATAERKELLEAWSQFRKSSTKLINHVGHTSLREAQELAVHSKAKADAVAAIAPFYFGPSNAEKLLEYCKAIAEAAELPFYYYHLPALTGVNFDMVGFSEMAVEQIPNFAGIKFTENNVVEFQKLNAAQPDLDIFFGVDEAFIASLSLGAKGWVGSTYNHMAPLYQKIHASFSEGDLEEANRLQSLAIYFVESLAAQGGFNGAGKSFMKLLGLDCGPSRYPHSSLSTDDLKQTKADLDKKGLTELLTRC